MKLKITCVLYLYLLYVLFFHVICKSDRYEFSINDESEVEFLIILDTTFCEEGALETESTQY